MEDKMEKEIENVEEHEVENVEQKPGKKKKKKKGFTLIELLAVIVILGLLMAIAIPSVTRYITQSRKKSLITTMGNYTGALVNEVNSLEYSLTASNTVYAIPIECISLERGGNSPFGVWYQANDSYFAYVLVQYDEDNSSYRYAFTFKDSAGYGMYPTAQSSLSGNDKNIKTGLSLTRPQNGKITTLTAINNWDNSGFEVTSDTEMKVLVSESEGKYGDGINTCTLQQKGSNYAQVEEEKKNQQPEVAPPKDEEPEEPVPNKIVLESLCTDGYNRFASEDDVRVFEYDFEEGMTWREWIDSSYNTDYKFSNSSFPLSGRAGLFDADGAGVCCEYVFSGINGGTVSLDSVMQPGTYRFDRSSGQAQICWD